MTENRIGLPQGTLDALILKAISLEPLHGWAISERLHQISDESLRIGQGSIYPALLRLQRKGWIKATWGVTENNRRAKYYALTRAGHQQLASRVQGWQRLIAIVGRVLLED
jgi:PadR family transcriptional regulator PadR